MEAKITYIILGINITYYFMYICQLCKIILKNYQTKKKMYVPSFTTSRNDNGKINDVVFVYLEKNPWEEGFFFQVLDFKSFQSSSIVPEY